MVVDVIGCGAGGYCWVVGLSKDLSNYRRHVHVFCSRTELWELVRFKERFTFCNTGTKYSVAGMDCGEIPQV